MAETLSIREALRWFEENGHKVSYAAIRRWVRLRLFEGQVQSWDDGGRPCWRIPVESLRAFQMPVNGRPKKVTDTPCKL